MAFIRTKGPIPSDSNNYYKYLVKTISENGESKQKHLAYLGPADGPDDTSLGDIDLSELNEKLDDKHELGYGEYEDLANYGSTKGKGADEKEQDENGQKDASDAYDDDELQLAQMEFNHAVNEELTHADKKQLMEEIEEDYGWAIAEQLENILEGEPIKDQNPAALRDIERKLREEGHEHAEMADSIQFIREEDSSGTRETSVRKKGDNSKKQKKDTNKIKINKLNKELKEGDILQGKNPEPGNDYYIPYKYTGKTKKMDDIKKYFFRDERSPDKYGKWFSKEEIKEMAELTFERDE